MKYEIFINGGFANIPKQFEGEINLKEAEKKDLLATLSKASKPSGEIHDGFIYHVRITDADTEIKSIYDEHNLPQIVRGFIETIQQNNE